MPLDGRLMMMMDANAYKSAIGSEAVKISHDLGSPPPGSATDDFPVDFDTAGKMLGSGLIAIDPDRLILIANRQATEVLQANEALGLRKGALFIERASIHRTFEAMLKTAVEAHAEGSPPPPSNFLGIPGRSGDIRYAIKIVIVTQRRDRTEILLALIDFFDNQATSRSTVASVFRLSEREAELAELFSLGYGLEEISARMGVALNTTRVHLRSVFNKTNCSGQLALLRTLSRLT